MSHLTNTFQPEPRPTANPGPLGLAGFGLTTVVLSCVNAGLLSHEAVPVVVPLAFAYGGVAQIIAGILEFRTGNTFGMVAFLSYGLFWWWFAMLQWTVGAGWLAQPPASAVATVLLMWGVLTFPALDRDLPPEPRRLEHLSAALDYFLFPRGRRLRLLNRQPQLQRNRRISGHFDRRRRPSGRLHRDPERNRRSHRHLTRATHLPHLKSALKREVPTVFNCRGFS